MTMWFKTRVALVSIENPVEILVFHDIPNRAWNIYVCPKNFPNLRSKTLWGSQNTVANPTSYLACFADGPDVKRMVGDCLAVIETAIHNKADICDLSRAGDAQAWRKSWQQIEWPGQRSSDKP